MPPDDASARPDANPVMRIAVREAANGRLAVRIDDDAWHTTQVEPRHLDQAVVAKSDATRKYGERLFSVFMEHPSFAGRYAEILEADDDEARIELTIALDEGATALAPSRRAERHMWEAARDRDGTHLALTKKLALCRRAEDVAAADAPVPTDPVRLSAGFATPSKDETGHDLPNVLNLLAELKALRTVSESHGDAVAVRDEEVLGLGNFEDAITDADVFHFAGHGEQGQLQLCGPGGRRELMSGDAIQQTIGEPPHLVVLNCCRGAATPDSAVSVAQSFLRAGVPAVVAMQGDIDDDASTLLTKTLYESLLQGEEVATAVQRTRRALYGRWPDRNWFLPVLWLGAPRPFPIRTAPSSETPLPLPPTPPPVPWWKQYLWIGLVAAVVVGAGIGIAVWKSLDDPTDCVERALEHAAVREDTRRALAEELMGEGPQFGPTGWGRDVFEKVNDDAFRQDVQECVGTSPEPALKMQMKCTVQVQDPEGGPFVGALVALSGTPRTCTTNAKGICSLGLVFEPGTQQTQLRLFAPGADPRSAEPLLVRKKTLAALIDGPWVVMAPREDERPAPTPSQPPPAEGDPEGKAPAPANADGGETPTTCDPCPAVEARIKERLKGRSVPEGVVDVGPSGKPKASPPLLQRQLGAWTYDGDMCGKTCKIPIPKSGRTFELDRFPSPTHLPAVPR